MVWVLTGLLTLLSAMLGVTFLHQRMTHRFAAHVPRGYRLLETVLGQAGERQCTLCDDEWGLVGRPNLVLEGPNGVVVVEYKRAWPGHEAGKARPSHILQLGALMMLCEADPRVGTRPSEGWIRYVDDRGKIVPGGQVPVENTDHLRELVVGVLQRMRRHLVTGIAAEPTHRHARKCARCGVAKTCQEVC